MKNKAIIDIYNTMYDVFIVVCNKHVTLKQIRSKYKAWGGKDITEDDIRYAGVTISCVDKSTGYSCILIKINEQDGNNAVEKQQCLINTITHEATHAALNIYEKIHSYVSLDCQEPFAYLMGWLSECIYKTCTKK